MQSIFDYWASIWFLITDHAIWLSTRFSIRISAFPYVLEFSWISTYRVVNSSVRLLILPIPLVLRSSHVFTLKALADGLRLSFLSHVLSTRILNVSRRKLNCVLVSCWTWVSLSLHLSYHIRINCCWGIFNVLLSVVLVIFHRDDYKIIIIVGKIILTASIVPSRRQRSVDNIGTCLALGIEILIRLSPVNSRCIYLSLIMSLWRANAYL